MYTIPKTTSLTLPELSQTLTELVHVKSIQRIGTEEIFSGTLFSTPLKVLIHAKFGAQKIDIKVLTKAPPLTQAVVALLKAILGSRAQRNALGIECVFEWFIYTQFPHANH